jgi:small conductance mechanosensitive channel
MQAMAQEATGTTAAQTATDAAAEAAPVQPIDVSPEALTATLNSWVDGFYSLLPNIGVSIVVLLVFWALSHLARRVTKTWCARHDRDNLGNLLGGFIKAAVMIVGVLLALTVVLPSLKPADLLAGLGIGSVAIGFAFKDILQNWLAGLLILINRPFKPGDQIVVNGYEGVVDHIETRVTAINTYDKRLALIPNADVYTNAVIVNTAFEVRRSQYDVGIGYADDIRKAKKVILKAVQSVEGVEKDPAPQVLVTDLAASWVTLRPRWWTNSVRSDIVGTQSDVIEAIKYALDEAGIDMPYETSVQLFHDQTEETDGKPAEQREGWPAAGGTPPRSRLDVELETSNGKVSEKRTASRRGKASKKAA